MLTFVVFASLMDRLNCMIRCSWHACPVVKPPLQVSFCRGSATDLMDIVAGHPCTSVVSGPTVVTCVNNTMGVFPDAIKPRTYSQVERKVLHLGSRAVIRNEVVQGPFLAKAI